MRGAVSSKLPHGHLGVLVHAGQRSLLLTRIFTVLSLADYRVRDTATDCFGKDRFRLE